MQKCLEMQIANIFHPKPSRKLFLHLQKLGLIIAHQDEIIDLWTIQEWEFWENGKHHKHNFWN
jgi:hypothetical protein